MKPKEQAEQMVNEYCMILMNEDTECGNEILCTMIAVKCALVSVNQLQLQAGNQKFGNYLAMQYWLDVEKEIKNYEQ